MSEELGLQIAVLIHNIIALILFAILAILFKKWWIILFAAIFCVRTETEAKEDAGTQAEKR